MKTTRITYDWDGVGRAPRAGDMLCTVTGITYLIVEARQVKSRVHRSRWAFQVMRLGKRAYNEQRALFQLRWKPRGRA